MTILNSSDFSKIPLVFNVYKPVGLSSFQVVNYFKKNLNFDFGKIGHFGTLDPFAEGVLLIGIQGAQKMNDYVHQYLPKTYEALGIFGQRTSTGDFTSLAIEAKELDDTYQKMSITEMNDLLKEKFLGEYWQSPHAVSAAKFEGKRLYQHALEGKIIQKEKVRREIRAFNILSYDYPYMRFSVTVSSGTYVRSLFEEIALFLNGLGTLKELKRTSIGNLTIKTSLYQDDWPKKDSCFDLQEKATPLDDMFPLRSIILTTQHIRPYLQGQQILLLNLQIRESEEEIHSQNLVWVYSETDHLIGLAKIQNDKLCAIFNLKEAITLFCSTS